MAETQNRNALLIHASAYVVVNAILLAINATQSVDPGHTRTWWAIWPLAGWGIGLAAHGFAYWTEKNSREGQLLADPDVRGVAVHLFVYLAVNSLLVTVNVITSPQTLWSIWPILGWGLGLAAHAYLAYRAVLKRTVQRYATEQQVLTEIQLEKQAAKIAAEVAPAVEKKPATRSRRKQTAAETTRKTSRKTPAKKPPKATASKSTKKPAAGSAKSKRSTTTRRTKKTAPKKS